MSRIKTLRNAVAASTLASKQTLVNALDVCLASPHRQAGRAAIEPLLAFGSKKSSYFGDKRASEDSFRLHARLAIVLLGWCMSPPRLEAAKDLHKAFSDKKYGDLAFAQAQFEKVRSIAWCIQGESIVTICDIDQFSAATRRADADIQDRLIKAATIAAGTLERCAEVLRQSNDLSRLHFVRWFGSERNRSPVLNGFNRMAERLRDRINPVQLDFEAEDVWGKTSHGRPNISIGARFFSDKTLLSSDLALRYYKTPDAVRHAKDSVQKMESLKKQEHLLGQIENSISFGAHLKTMQEVLDDFAETAIIANKTTPQAQFVALGASLLRDLGIDLADRPSAARPKLAAGQKAIDSAKADLVRNQGDLATMEVTAHGTIIHELSHMVLNTDDVDATSIGVPGLKCYGPLLCQMLAAERPDLAMRNADSYRHFAESFGPG